VISQRGHDDIERLLAATELENVPADVRLANDLLGTAARHVTSARSIANDDPIGAFQAAYDALRKAATALLAAQGLRATSRGGQLAVQDAVTAQFGGSTGTTPSQTSPACAELATASSVQPPTHRESTRTMSTGRSSRPIAP
jgi:hypothetical protein